MGARAADWVDTRRGLIRALSSRSSLSLNRTRRALHGHVPPGGTGKTVWIFNRAGASDFACLISGHYQAGHILAWRRSCLALIATAHGVPDTASIKPGTEKHLVGARPRSVLGFEPVGNGVAADQSTDALLHRPPKSGA